MIYLNTIIIAVCWISKMALERRVLIRKTPLDIPLFLFLVSQIISSIFSLDTHVSLWGYYSRFNGGLFSLLSYIFLYYAFVTNLQVKHVLRILVISLVSGVFTALWGFPSHFGYDPTCLVFRGTLDTNCWTDQFKPTVRIFSTLGQPAWFAAYLDVLLPLSMAYALLSVKKSKRITFALCFIISLLFYACLIFADTRAGTVAFIGVDILFWIVLFWKKFFDTKTFSKYFFIFNMGFAVTSFFFGAPIPSLTPFTFEGLQKHFVVHAQTSSASHPAKTQVIPTGITDSAQIRLIVWKGAIQAWEANPIFGTGVETFAYAYYKYRPAEHNMTSEWDYLYNKAHNEYLNYLTTTGIVGLGTYLAIIFVFLFIAVRYILRYTNPTHNDHASLESKRNFLYTSTLLCSYITILITNFFGFSVAIMNLYLFCIPAFVFLILNMLDTDRNYAFVFGATRPNQHIKHAPAVNGFQWTLIIVFFLIAGSMILGLFRFWYADTEYAYGMNLDHASAYQQAFQYLKDANNIIPDEPVYQDEYAVDLATLAAAFYTQNDGTNGAQFANQAIAIDNQVVTNHPNNVVFWKNRLRIFYSLANADNKDQAQYFNAAMQALQKASTLAPTDAKISYNLGVMLGQGGNLQDGVSVLEKTIQLKPDYYDAYYALGLLYHQLAITPPGQPASVSASASASEKVIDQQWQNKAIDTYQFIHDNLNSHNDLVNKTLATWKKE